ncbi:transcriptional regulator [Natrarchaeobius oligotrophus]|uniref:Transcriptional regulator n=1 Tax=Natrarchaeobius chitinivorans TaxID=1679083 RepID=A0A3N6M6M6_NATCH|nr:transcriptional regulator [Natrarchaeobius chitinivorans]RQG99238.1 transcriptional regulator [Natrarchaeobius chitinivorans]
MTSDDSDRPSAEESLDPNAITERFTDLEVGDTLTVNNHELTYEVVDTDTYAVIAEDPDGHQVTFSQNLQSGGWAINEPVFFVESVDE